MQLFRTEKQLAGAASDVAVLNQFGVPYELLDADGCIGAEPALSPMRDKIAGGLRLPNDETGDCALFTQRLAERCSGAGVRVLFETTINRIVDQSGRIAGVDTSGGLLTGDAYVVALGSYSPLLLRDIGISIPVYPIKGYSLTLPIVDVAAAPVSTVMDETYKIAITRLGDRIRVGGTAEVSGYNLTLNDRRRATLAHSVGDLFPAGGDMDRSTFWCGLRPMTPDGPPLLGSTRYGKLYLNTGHGTLVWTMACGSGRFVADLVSNRPTDIDVGDLGVERRSP